MYFYVGDLGSFIATPRKNQEKIAPPMGHAERCLKWGCHRDISDATKTFPLLVDTHCHQFGGGSALSVPCVSIASLSMSGAEQCPACLCVFFGPTRAGFVEPACVGVPLGHPSPSPWWAWRGRDLCQFVPPTIYSMLVFAWGIYVFGQMAGCVVYLMGVAEVFQFFFGDLVVVPYGAERPHEGPEVMGLWP